MRFAAMPAVAVRRASLPATAQRWELRWLVLASGYNRLFSSRRLRFLGDLQGCPAPRHSFVAEQGRTGATLSVFHLQPSDGLRGPVACAVLGRSGPAPRQVPRESWRASRTFLPLAGKTACGALRRHLASRRIRRRDAFQRDTGPAFERSLSRPASRRFYDDHHRSGTRARTDALRRCRHLFPARLDLLYSACHGRGATLSRSDSGNRNLAELSARSAPTKGSRAFRERTHLRPIIRALPKLPRRVWFLPAALFERCSLHCQRLPHAERKRCGTHPCSRSACRSRRRQR